MTQDPSGPTRRHCLFQAGWAIAAAPLLLAAGQARAAGKTPKADVHYQYTPKNDQRCGDCASFLPPTSPEGPGSCRVVDGPIPPNGWCELFSKK